MSFHTQKKRSVREKNKSVEDTRQQAMTTDELTAVLLQNLDENINTALYKE